MNGRKSIPYDDYDGFDECDDIDPFDGFSVIDTLDETSTMWYTEFDGDIPVCEFDVGDRFGLCIKEKYGCHIEGCPFADPNE